MEKKKMPSPGDFAALFAPDISVASVVSSLYSELQCSEYDLITFMNSPGQNKWQGALPAQPAGCTSNSGYIELALFLYWFNNPSLIQSPTLSSVVTLFTQQYPPPASLITQVNYDTICDSTMIYSDGSVLSTATLCTFDQGWFTAFFNLITTISAGAWYNNENFPMPSPAPTTIPLTGAVANKVSIALMGDWGAGNSFAQSVKNEIVNLSPDYIAHVGDVYYSGAPASADDFWYYFSSDEEMNNLVNAWPPNYSGKSFTLNSNHEMYTGANGLFIDALNATASTPGSGSPFSLQQGLSCFALSYGGWTILGLDTAYNGTSLDAFMSGNIGGATDAQAQWIAGLKLTASQTIVLTHHNGFAYDCSATETLWGQVNAALGGDPYAWYWGHVHNGIVYTNPVKIGSFSTNTYARCLGHASLPYGTASQLSGNQYVEWVESNQQPSSTLLYNGFAILTFETDKNGNMTTISEQFYDISKSPAPVVWSKVIFGGS